MHAWKWRPARVFLLSFAACGIVTSTFAAFDRGGRDDDDRAELNHELENVLQEKQFTGRIESTLEERLGRTLNPQLAELGRLLFFDIITGLHDDNTCAGCHSPTNGFADSQSMAIGVQNNFLVGPHRLGPCNQRRTPSIANAAFYPKLMWNGRFASLSGDPFDNSKGFQFPPPEGTTRFPANEPIVNQLLIAQAHMPPTEMTEVAGFTGTKGTISPAFDQFDDGRGSPVPPPDASGFRNEPIRHAVLKRLNGNARYRQLFGALFPEVASGAPIDFSMFARAIAEFEFTQVYANAPLDKFARGDLDALDREEKQGALLFFGKAKCYTCHAVGGGSNEMFSDFEMHNIAIPQIAPAFGVGKGNVVFDGPNANEDYGLEQITGNRHDRYKFRSSPLRNAALQPAFFHNGAFTRLEDAIRHHLDVRQSVLHYNAVEAGVTPDLAFRTASPEAMLRTVDPLLAEPLHLEESKFRALVKFVRFGLLDNRARRRNLCGLVPETVPSGMAVLQFEGCRHE